DVAGAIACLDYVLAMKQRGVNIVATNNSWGAGLFSQALVDAIGAQRDHGILFVAAAGNSGGNNDTLQTYPCSYDISNVVCVAATDQNDALAWFSNYGRSTVHIAAPGVDILSTLPGNQYQTLSGTSMAAPHVAGTIALLYADDPAADWRLIRNRLLSGAETTWGALNTTITGRRTQAWFALRCRHEPLVRRLQPRTSTASTSSSATSTPIRRSRFSSAASQEVRSMPSKPTAAPCPGGPCSIRRAPRIPRSAG